MELKGKRVLIMGGAGLVGLAVARRVLTQGPTKVLIGSLRQSEVEAALADLSADFPEQAHLLEGFWGDLFVPEAMRLRDREEVFADEAARAALVDDVYAELTQEVIERSALGRLLLDARPDIIIDAINTAGALAYRNAFKAASELREEARNGGASIESVETLLGTLYLPQLIRHVQIALEAMKQVGTGIFVKIGTAGTGGMGLNIPFTHSEERPSRVLLAKSSLAGAQTLLLFLMARTPGAPAIKEIKPTAAISWKSIGTGPVLRGGRPILRSDSTGSLPLDQAFGEEGFIQTEETLDGVFLDAGENGLFSPSEFEALTALGLMEFVTPEEIAENVMRELTAHPTGKDVVAALDAATMGPTYRAGVLRGQVLDRMDEMEAEAGVESVAYEMLGPPRLSKLLFEVALIRRLYPTMKEAAEMDAEGMAQRVAQILDEDTDMRQRILSVGLPILLPAGDRVMRGAHIKMSPEAGLPLDHPRNVDSGWVDLRPENWLRWKDRFVRLNQEIATRPDLREGSQADHAHGDRLGRIRPGRVVAWIFRVEDHGERIKR